VLPDGYQGGIYVNGRFSQVSNNFVTTNSTSLGLNNTGMNIAGSGNIAEGNYVEKTCFGYSLTGDGHAFRGNEATRLKMNGSCGDVDYMRFFGSNHVIDNNYFHGINMQEIGAAHVDCFQSFDNGGPAYSISNVIVERNYCSDAAQGMMLEGKVYKQSSGLIVRNNVFKRNGAWCVCSVDIANVRFYNNTCDTTGTLHGIWCRGNNSISTCEFKNNIFYGTGTTYGVMETASLIDGTPESPGKNNLLFNPTKLLTGYQGDIKNTDPRFVDQNIGDYKLKQGSPAIDSGLNISPWSNPTDNKGTTRPQGASWDIGAFEFQHKIPFSPSNLIIK